MASLTLLFTAVLIWGSLSLALSQSGDCDDVSCVSVCPLGQYYSDESFNSTSCCVWCDMSSNQSSAGSGMNCLPCDQSCDDCFGPSPDHCHICQGPYIVLSRGADNALQDDVICESGLFRNSSLDVVSCVDSCPAGASLDNDTMECTCDSGYYQNGSYCMECIDSCSSCVNGTQAGCMLCSGVLYNNDCLRSCPQNTFNINGRCLMGESKLALDASHIIAIIAGAVGVIILVFIWLVVCLCCCIWKARANKNKYETAGQTKKKASVVISESFKRVTRPKPMNKNIESTNSLYLHDLRHSYDPYTPRHDTAVMETSSDYTREVKPGPAITRGGVHQESTYVKMSPAPSVEQLEGSQSNLLMTNGHKKAGTSLSFQGQTSQTDRVQVAPRSHSTLPQGTSYDEQYEQYEDPSQFMNPGDYESPTNWHSQPDDYELEEGEEEQGMYEDLSGNFTSGPTIPQRSVRPVVNVIANPQTMDSPSLEGDRRETLDNSYVVMRKSPQPHLLSSENLFNEHKYVNVARGGQHRIRAVTSPEMSSSVNDTEEGELYEEMTAPTTGGIDDEIYY